MSEPRWHKINVGLLLAIILVNCYTIGLPWLPALRYNLQTRHNPETTLPVSQFVAKTTSNQSSSGNRLIIPRLLIDAELVEGPMSDSFSLLNKGAWQLPIGVDPSKAGNTVIAGHRFSYTGPRGIFYGLDKLQVGDQIGIRWNGTLYTYAVESSQTHAATDIYVEGPTNDTRLTLYTCTPLWNPVNRLVVIAKPVKGSS